MSAISRVFGSAAARSIMMQQHRNIASVTAADPIQKLFVDKIREFKSTNKGLDAAHERALKEEMTRLARVYKIDDENKLTHVDHKFSGEQDVRLHDIDEAKELRAKIHSGDYQKQLVAAPEPESALLATTPEQVTLDLHLPPMNKPDAAYLNDHYGVPGPTQIGEYLPDYNFVGDKMTPQRMEREMRVHFGENMPTIDDDKAPERDVVNFPRLPQPMDTPPTRYHVIPESWFQFFYPKTGVTGPYVFFGGFSTFLLSKEWVPIEHEFATMCSTAIIMAWAVTKFGPAVRKYVTSQIDKTTGDWDKWQHGNIEFLGQAIQHYKDEVKKIDVLDELYNARRQDIDVQLEAERRNRVKIVYDDVKRRLNFLVAKADAQRQISHNNMVNWVISNVLSSIDQKRENEVLDSCIAGLRLLGQKNANVV